MGAWLGAASMARLNGGAKVKARMSVVLYSGGGPPPAATTALDAASAAYQRQPPGRLGSFRIVDSTPTLKLYVKQDDRTTVLLAVRSLVAVSAPTCASRSASFRARVGPPS
jgi:hypothetical protein